MKSRPEVVITGLGAVTPAGDNVDQTWDSLVEGRGSVSALEVGEGDQGRIYPVGRVSGDVALDSSRDQDRCVRLAQLAAGEALGQAGLGPDEGSGAETACVFSLSKPPPDTFERIYQSYRRTGHLDGKDVIGQVWPDSCCVHVAQRYGLIGPRLCLPAACATGAQAVIRAAALIADGQAKRVLAGAAEASLTPLYLAAFDRMGVLAKDTDQPQRACKPFDRRRCGFVPAEGAAAVVLESAASAGQRGARPLARILGSWRGMHALDMLQLEDKGKSLAVGIKRALARARLEPGQVDHILAHGTGTLANDISETAAIKRAMREAAYNVSISSHKGAVGHLLAGAGALQVVVAVKSMGQGLVPLTVNLEEADPQCDLDYTAGAARQREVRHSLCITAGFGGQCGIIVLAKE